ncbi:hypothetical protein L1987_70875 [Smallanthus sonchifolius]|uniref:Uncharacterized protein n=1 Tax=Smallanthus sonchifolius TaxID=185202 RepID=A0ACB9AQI6_9ASTR|nr:hypothetical protein L1987_70875 [Smallanthus sonchifolius]
MKGFSSDESMLIVHALLEVAAHPEYDIAFMTLNFWHNLQICLIERLVAEFTVADILIDAALVLRGETTLQILYMKLVEVQD